MSHFRRRLLGLGMLAAGRPTHAQTTTVPIAPPKATPVPASDLLLPMLGLFGLLLLLGWLLPSRHRSFRR